MVFLQPSTTESAFVFSTDDGSDAILLDVKGIYALIDGGSEPLRFMDSVRTPSAAILSTASPSSLTNAIELNRKSDSLVAVVGNLPSPASLKDAAAAQPIRELYKTLAVAPVMAQLKGSKPEPIVIHKGLSSGTLSVYTLAGDAKDAEAVAKAYQSGSSDSIEAAAAAASSVLLIVWQPVREDAPIKRILHLGSAPLSRIQQALSVARSLPFLHSSTATAASLKAKPAASAAPTRPAARSAAAPTAAAKPTAARVAPAARPTAPAARPAPTARATPTPAAAARPSSVRASLPTRAPAAPAASATRPARTTTGAGTRPAVPTGRAAARPSTREEVAKKTVVGKSSAAPSSRSAASSSSSTPNGSASRTPTKAATASAVASPAAAAVAAVAATTVVAASLSPSEQPIESLSAPAAAPLIVTTDPVEGEEMEEGGGGGGETPGGMPVPPSPTIIPATPQPPMSPEPEEEEEEKPVHEATPPSAPVEEKEEEEEKTATPAVEEGVDGLLDVTQASNDARDEEEEEETPTPPTPSASLEPTVSMDEPQCVKEMVEDEPEPTPTPVEPEVTHEEKEPVTPVEPEPVPAPVPTPTPAPEGDLLGDFDTPVEPQQPGDDGLLDSLEEPMKKMQISMDTDKLAEELGLTGGEKEEERGEVEGNESLLDLTQPSIMDSDLDKTQNTSVIESAHEYDDLLSPRGIDVDDLQRKLSEQAEESLLSVAAAPFITGLASTVVEAATIDGAKSTLESLISTRSVESPTGDKLLSFRSSGFENPDEPKEVKYEESDPAIDDVLSKLAEESEMVNGGLHHGELNGHGDTGANGHHIVNGSGWPEGTTMHLPPPPKGSSARETKFKLAGPVHVDLVTVPHRGKQILLNDEAASIEFFSSVRSSMYILQSGGEVPVHVLDGWMKGKGQWAVNVPSRLIPTHHNEAIVRWIHEHGEEMAEVGLTVVTPVDLTTLTYPDGQAKACTIVL